MINGMYITGSTKMLMYTSRLREDKIDPGRVHRGDRDYGKKSREVAYLKQTCIVFKCSY